MFEVREEAGLGVIVLGRCSNLKQAVNRQRDLRQIDQRRGWWVRATYIVDTKAAESYSVPHPSKRLKGPVFVRGGLSLAQGAR